MLVNSLYSTGVRPKANVIMSFNNKPASEAVPYFDQVRTRFNRGWVLVTPSLMFEASVRTSRNKRKAYRGGLGYKVDTFIPTGGSANISRKTKADFRRKAKAHASMYPQWLSSTLGGSVHLYPRAFVGQIKFWRFTRGFEAHAIGWSWSLKSASPRQLDGSKKVLIFKPAIRPSTSGNRSQSFFLPEAFFKSHGLVGIGYLYHRTYQRLR
jgi:hypothetical protein